MRTLLLLAAALLGLASPSPATAEVQVRLRMGFPAVLPPLVVVQPGVRVVQDFDEEVFFTGGYYWVQRDHYWYRARDHRGTWSQVRPGRIPAALANHEPGRYRRWQHDERRSWPEARQARGGARHWRAADHREGGHQQGGHPEGGHQERGGEGNRDHGRN